MPVSIASQANLRKTTTITITTGDGPEPLTVTWYPNRNTGQLDAQLQQAVDSGDSTQLESLAKRLQTVIESWDLVGLDGATAPINLETASLLGQAFLTEFFSKLQDSVTPGKKTR